MNPSLDEIVSIINGYTDAADNQRVFTYIEFVKLFGYENDVNVFITFYKDYVTRWANAKKASINVSDDEFVFSKMVDILKSITLDYSSYEEQDFISHINLYNKAHIKALSSLYARKIRQITEFYRKKRNEAVTIVRKNSSKGSTKSVQEIIYEKVFDFIFSNKNIVPSYKDIKRDLVVSIENYVDTYSDYFDIPRRKEFTDKTRAQMLSANMNSVDYRMYLEIELVVSELLFSGNVMLEEIPLIAQLGLDLGQSCVGDMLALKNSLMANTTVNQVDLTEQISLKRKLYEKFLGVDLWYLYVDLKGDVKLDVLCKAKNPTGNLLNCGTADTATIENEQLTLLSHIGLFFKPDKTSILKINAKNYEWGIDTDKITKDTMYIFPDPNKYGDIGNNKDAGYPLIMEYDLKDDVRNLSSGEAKNDPLLFISDQGWFSYYSKQDDDFKLFNNNNYDYAFTFLANRGFISNYQKDVWGNEFAIFKGSKTETVNDEVTGKKKTTITVYSQSTPSEMSDEKAEQNSGKGILLNGGYFADPFDENKPFDFDKKLKLDQNYRWSGLSIDNPYFYIPFGSANYVNFGEFGSTNDYVYEDHFGFTSNQMTNTELEDDNVITKLITPFFTVNLLENPQESDVEIIYDNKEWKDFSNESGTMFVKYVHDTELRPIDIKQQQYFKEFIKQVDEDGNQKDASIISFNIINDTLVLETADSIKFIPYGWNGQSFEDKFNVKNNLHELYEIKKQKKMATKLLYNEDEQCFYVLQLRLHELSMDENGEKIRNVLVPQIYKFNPKKYRIQQVLNTYDIVCNDHYIKNNLNKSKLFSDFVKLKETIIDEVGKDLYDDYLRGDTKLIDLEIPFFQQQRGLGDVKFSYNGSHKRHLISFVTSDLNGTPYLYQIKFNLKHFEETVEVTVYSILSGDLQNVTVVDNGQLYTYPYNGDVQSVLVEENNVEIKYQPQIWRDGQVIDGFDGNWENISKINYVYYKKDKETYNYNLRKNIKDFPNITTKNK